MRRVWYKKRNVVIMIILLCIFGFVGTSYALWQLTLKQETTNRITSGCFNVEYTDKNNIELLEAVPITDTDGEKLIPYEFTLTNTCNILVKYQINLEVMNTTNLNNEYVKVKFQDNKASLLTTNNTVVKTLPESSTAYNLAEGVLAKKGSKTFNLRLWLNETTPATDEAMNKTFASKIVVNTVQSLDTYTEDILNGADPVLKDNLVPVTIASDGTVTKADVKKEWYNYEEKQWANAVILKDDSKDYALNTVIPESDIESYFVWIPRYRYKIFNDEKYTGLTDIDSTKVQTIEVEFETNGVTPSTGNKKDEWLTHPAFTSFNANGMWVGKFETSKSNTAPTNSINAVGVQIKPNITSWRSISVGNAFYTSYYYQRNLDSHMMKNSEWGAVAYLQHSKYGSSKDIRFNNNSNFITGYASTKEPTCGYTNDNRDCNKYGTTSDITLAYNTATGILASTTENISGIYDISGGAWEYVMGVMTNQSGVPLSGGNASGNSGFTGGYGEGGSLASGYSWPSEKYYDKYAHGTSYSEFTRGHLGDATTEMGPFRSIIYANNVSRQISSWHADYADFVNTANPWFLRGGAYNHGTEPGSFAFSRATGAAYENLGFRVVLTP